MGDPDRISSLPVEVLELIAPLVPTKFMAGMATLSTGWRSFFSENPATTVNLDLDDSHRCSNRPTGPYNFVSFVNKGLQMAQTNGNLRLFRLWCRHTYAYGDDEFITGGEATLRGWLRTALAVNTLQELDLSPFPPLNGLFEIYTCKTLEVVKLHQTVLLKVPEGLELPNLRVLHLEETTVDSEVTFASYFSTSPALEEFIINESSFASMNAFAVHHQVLQKLVVDNCRHCFRHVLLDTPRLRHLEFNLFLRKPIRHHVDFEITHIHSLLAAGFAMEPREEKNLGDQWPDTHASVAYEKAARLINSLSHVRSLHLSRDTLKILYRSEVRLTTFHHLTFMELDSLHYEGRLLFPALLHSCPNLRVLTFYWGFGDYDGSDAKKYELRLQDVKPLCVSSSLREVRLGAFRGSEFELQIVKYFLANAQMLEKLMVGPAVLHFSPFGFSTRQWSSYDTDQKSASEAGDILSRLPRCSQACQIILSWTENGKGPLCYCKL